MMMITIIIRNCWLTGHVHLELLHILLIPYLTKKSLWSFSGAMIRAHKNKRSSSPAG